MNPREPFHNWLLWLPYIYLLEIGTPWYWQFLPEELSLLNVLGMPLWALVSVLASLGVSVYTAVLLMQRWPGELQEQADGKDDV